MQVINGTQPFKKLGIVQGNGNQSPERPVEVHGKPACNTHAALHEAERPRHDHRAALYGGLRFFIAGIRARQVVADHAFISLDRINVRHNSTRRQKNIAHDALGRKQPRYLLKALRAAVVLHEKGL